MGDIVNRMTDAMGIKACLGCERRRQILNRWVIRGSRAVIKKLGPDTWRREAVMMPLALSAALAWAVTLRDAVRPTA